MTSTTTHDERGWTITAHRDVQRVHTFDPREPDPAWVETDGNSHSHTWASKNITWRYVKDWVDDLSPDIDVYFDADGEEYNIPETPRCAVCGVEVHPGLRAGPSSILISGPWHGTIRRMTQDRRSSRHETWWWSGDDELDAIRRDGPDGLGREPDEVTVSRGSPLTFWRRSDHG